MFLLKNRLLERELNSVDSPCGRRVTVPQIMQGLSEVDRLAVRMQGMMSMGPPPLAASGAAATATAVTTTS